MLELSPVSFVLFTTNVLFLKPIKTMKIFPSKEKKRYLEKVTLERQKVDSWLPGAGGRNRY